MTRSAKDLVASAMLALLAVLAWPLAPWSETEIHRVAITATGAKDARSQGSEVWLTGLPDGLDFPELLAGRSTSGGWEMRDGVAVSYRGQPSTLRFEGPLPGGGAFTFVRHGWSGEVTIEINGTMVTENLFDPAPDGKPLTLGLERFPAGITVATSRWPMFLTAWLATTFAIFLALKVLARMPAAAQYEERSSYARDTLRHALPALAIFVVVLLGTWPAQMSPDSVSQWGQLASGAYNNAHPVLHTILIGGPGYVLGSPGWSILLQIVLLALACGALAAEIRRWNVSPAAVWIVSFLVPLLPAVHLISTVFWKDVPYAAGIAVLTAMMMALARTGGALARRPDYVLAFALTLFLVATFRHNGILVAAGTLVLIGLVMRRRAGRRLLAAGLVAGVALPVLWSAVVLPAVGVGGVGRHYGGIIPLHLLGGMVAADAIGDQDTLERLDAILPMEEWRETYDCLNVVPLFWAPGIDYGKIDASLFLPAIRAAIAAPDVALAHLLCVNSSVWRLSPTEGAVHTLVPLGIWKAEPPLDAPGLVEQPVIPKLNVWLKAEFAWTTASTPRFVLFWRPTFMFLLLAGCLAMAVLRNPSACLPLALACAPALLNTLSMMPLTGSQDFRYQLPIYMIGPFLMALAIGAGQNAGFRAGTTRENA